MFPSLKKLRHNVRQYFAYDPETEALNQAVDRIEIEMIHRRFSKNQNRGPFGY